MTKTNTFSPEVRARALRLVPAHRSESPPLWAPMDSLAPAMGGVPQTLLACSKREQVHASNRRVYEAGRAWQQPASSNTCAEVST